MGHQPVSLQQQQERAMMLKNQTSSHRQFSSIPRPAGWWSLLALLLVGVMTFSLSAPASAAPREAQPAAPGSSQARIALQAEAVDPELLRQTETLIRLTSGSGTGAAELDADSAAEEGIPASAIEEWEAGLAAANGGSTTQASREISSLAAATCRGSNKWVQRWYGWDLYMNSCTVQQVRNYMLAGGSVLGLVSFITGKIPTPPTVAASILTGIAAGLYAIGAAALNICAQSGRGVIVRGSASLPFWCQSQ